ncbi:MAG: TIGR03960 family B12-binding radical SAM protein [Oscillospiraceae bacterium]
MIPKELERVLLEVQKPARYIGGEHGSIIKDKSKVDIRIAFCFPDMYEVGMSHLGMKILYSLYNNVENYWCERVFAPDVDMEAVMRKEKILLYGLESFDPIKDFDFIAFTLQYEMSYTGVLNMLDLAGVPIRAKDRPDLSPLVIAGGPCACNPEPLTAFVDLFVLGEGEKVNLEVNELYLIAKQNGWSKEKYLHEASKIGGVYVPSLYEVTYNDDKTVKAVTPIYDDVPAKVTKRIIVDIDEVFYPKQFIVPFVEPVHDRVMVEVLRGCIRGCRFCQAGFIYRPFREKTADTINQNGKDLCASTGYNEVSLTSLSTSDLTEIEPLLDKMLDWSEEKHINLSLPSLRVDNFSETLLEKIAKVRKSGLTFAPEGGTQRIRDVINKNVSEEEIMNTCRTAFEGGYTTVKLYFMMGLPTETDEDIEGIAILAQKIVDMFYDLPTKPKGKGVTVSISCACFVPKPFTPFQFEPQDTIEEFERKQRYLRNVIRTRKVNLSTHHPSTSFIEAVLAKGDRRLCDVVEAAWKKGSRLDGWGEHLSIQRWTSSMEELGIDPAFYANRKRSYDEINPWEHLDYGVSKEFLIKENKLAHQDTTTPNCKLKCSACGANSLLKGGKCVAAKHQDFLLKNR